jgi:hypothetical protein
MGWVAVLGLLAVVAVAAVLVAVLASDICVKATLRRERSDDMIRICVTALFGLVRRQIVITALTWGDGGVKVIWRVEKGMDGTPPQQGQQPVSSPPPPASPPDRPDAKQHRTVTIDMKKIKKSYRKFYAMLMATRALKAWMADTARRIRCPELVWNTRIGLGDAAESALAAGVVWGFKAPLVGWFTRYVRMQSIPRLAVVPLFNEMYVETEFSGTFRMRAGSLLAALIRLIWRVVRVPGGLRRWRKVLGKKREKTRRDRRSGKKRLAGEA